MHQAQKQCQNFHQLQLMKNYVNDDDNDDDNDVDHQNDVNMRPCFTTCSCLRATVQYKLS